MQLLLLSFLISVINTLTKRNNSNFFCDTMHYIEDKDIWCIYLKPLLKHWDTVKGLVIELEQLLFVHRYWLMIINDFFLQEVGYSWWRSKFEGIRYFTIIVAFVIY